MKLVTWLGQGGDKLTWNLVLDAIYFSLLSNGEILSASDIIL